MNYLSSCLFADFPDKLTAFTVNYEWFYSELERLAPLATNFVDLRMHYTTNVDPETGSTGHPPFFKAGRPNISEIVHGAVSRTRGRVFIGGEYIIKEYIIKALFHRETKMALTLQDQSLVLPPLPTRFDAWQDH